MTSHTDRDFFTITDLARELAITPRTIRFYESKELIAPQRAGANRIYTHRDRGRLLIILRGKRLGFSLAGIKSFLDLYDADPKHIGQLRHLLKGVRWRIDQLTTQQNDLELTLEELREMEDQTLEAMRELGVIGNEEAPATADVAATGEDPEKGRAESTETPIE